MLAASESVPFRVRPRRAVTVFGVVSLLVVANSVFAKRQVNNSPAATLQLFESTWENSESRAADAFIAGYGSVWVPPPGRADTGGFSVGYDQFDRFDLGNPDSKTLYGTERSVRAMNDAWHRFGGHVYADLVWNHNGFRDASTPGFEANGGYPGFVTTLPNAIDGDFHSAFAGGDLEGRLAGLIDIDHSTNHRFIRNPVDSGDSRNIPNQAASAANRRFYQSHNGPSRTLFDPKTGETITVYDFRGDGSESIDGTPVEENALGYLMRNTQWYVQDVGFDGFRLDAVKHMDPYVLEYLDRAVYGANPRKLLDGSTDHVFSFGEVLDGNKALLQTYTRKDINPSQPNTIGGNRDVLDFPLHFALRDNLTSNGFANDWRNIVNASFDSNDDGLANNGSQGVAFDASHDEAGADLGNVANAYLSMRPGNWVVYHNAEQFGQNREFPKDGRGDALGGLYGDTITKLVNARNTHGRGDYRERWIEKETLIYERENSAIVGLSNRSDPTGGFDERWVDTGFAGGTRLIELTGNANDPSVDPFDDIPEVVRVENDGRAPIRVPRNVNANGQRHDKGYVIYGLPTPQGELSIPDSAFTISGGTPTAATNGTTRLADYIVVQADTFDVRLQTQAVTLSDGYRDFAADGDTAVLKVNSGLDVNGNGFVDNITPNTVTYGFEQFGTKSSPLALGGDGEFVQTVDTSLLPEGVNYLEVRAFRQRNDNGPAVYSTFKEVLYVDRLKPQSALFEVRQLAGHDNGFRQFIVESVDRTANSVHTFLDLPRRTNDEAVLRLVNGSNQAGQIDRDLFAYGYGDLKTGNHVLTVVTYEVTGTVNVQRFAGIRIRGGSGWGVGDVLGDNDFSPADVSGSDGFERFLYSQGHEFDPAADVDGDGVITNIDLFALQPIYEAAGATDAAIEARAAELRRGNVDLSGSTDASDIDVLFAAIGVGDDDWMFDLDADGVSGMGDMDVMIRMVFETEYGDANLDGNVDEGDFILLRDGYGNAGGWADGNFNGDGVVDRRDYDILATYFGAPGEWRQAPPIPEPAGGVLLLSGLTCMTFRRRNVVR